MLQSPDWKNKVGALYCHIKPSLSNNSFTSNWSDLIEVVSNPLDVSHSTLISFFVFSSSCRCTLPKECLLHYVNRSPYFLILSETSSIVLTSKALSQTALIVSPHPFSFIHICSKQNGLFLHAIIPSHLIRTGLWSEEWALRCCTQVDGFCSNQEVFVKAQSSLSSTKSPGLLPRHVNL